MNEYIAIAIASMEIEIKAWRVLPTQRNIKLNGHEYRFICQKVDGLMKAIEYLKSIDTKEVKDFVFDQLEAQLKESKENQDKLAMSRGGTD